MTLSELLKNTVQENYAVGSFNARCKAFIAAILKAAQKNNSPAIVQISQKELGLFSVTPKEFADEYYRCLKELQITVPTTLHLDHTKEIPVIHEAIEAGFESVMIDASARSFEENVAMTREVVEYAHARNVSVEAELGKIGTTDHMETDEDSELYTDPEEARRFVELTQVDALSVSVGTAHGVYKVKAPAVQFERIRQIHGLVPSFLVLHGGSGVPAADVVRAHQDGCGISKVNVATDLELAFLGAVGMERMTSAQCDDLDAAVRSKGLQAVEDCVSDKMQNYLCSAGKAW